MLPKWAYDEEEYRGRHIRHIDLLAKKSKTELIALADIALMTNDKEWFNELQTAYLARSV